MLEVYLRSTFADSLEKSKMTNLSAILLKMKLQSSDAERPMLMQYCQTLRAVAVWSAVHIFTKILNLNG